jgi:hypothetical protein
MQPKVQATQSHFEHELENTLARTSYFRVETDQDREVIYRLRYDAYRRENAIVARDDLRFTDRYDHDENACVFGVNIDGVLAGAIRLHVLSAEQRTGPAIDTYGDVLGPLVDAGESCIDPSRFVTNPAVRSGARLLPFAVTRLACMAAEYYEADWMLATVRIEHAAFYRRFCSLKPLTEPRAYPNLTKPLMLLGERNIDIRDSVFTRYPVFSSSLGERLALFSGVGNDQGARPLNDNMLPKPVNVA